MKKLFFMLVLLTSFSLAGDFQLKFDAEVDPIIFPYITSGEKLRTIVPASLLIGYKDTEKLGLDIYGKISGEYNEMTKNTLDTEVFLKYTTPFEVANGLKLEGRVIYKPYMIQPYYRYAKYIIEPYNFITLSFGTLYKKNALQNDTRLIFSIRPNADVKIRLKDNTVYDRYNYFELSLNNKFKYTLNNHKFGLNANVTYDNGILHWVPIVKTNDLSTSEWHFRLIPYYEYEVNNLKVYADLNIFYEYLTANPNKENNSMKGYAAQVSNLIKFEGIFNNNMSLKVSNELFYEFAKKEYVGISNRTLDYQFRTIYVSDTINFDFSYKHNLLKELQLIPGLKFYNYSKIMLDSREYDRFTYTVDSSGNRTNEQVGKNLYFNRLSGGNNIVLGEDARTSPSDTNVFLSNQKLTPYISLSYKPVDKFEMIFTTGVELRTKFNMKKQLTGQWKTVTLSDGREYSTPDYSVVTPDAKVVSVTPILKLSLSYNFD